MFMWMIIPEEKEFKLGSTLAVKNISDLPYTIQCYKAFNAIVEGFSLTDGLFTVIFYVQLEEGKLYLSESYMKLSIFEIVKYFDVIE